VPGRAKDDSGGADMRKASVGRSTHKSQKLKLPREVLLPESAKKGEENPRKRRIGVHNIKFEEANNEAEAAKSRLC